MDDALLHALVQLGDGGAILLGRGLHIALLDGLAQSAKAAADAALVGAVDRSSLLGLSDALERGYMVCHGVSELAFRWKWDAANEPSPAKIKFIGILKQGQRESAVGGEFPTKESNSLLRCSMEETFTESDVVQVALSGLHIKHSNQLTSEQVFMKVMQINATGRDPLLVSGELAQPQPKNGDVLIRVNAAGVIPTELGWSPTTQKKDGTPRKSAVPTHEFSGTVAALGEDVTGIDLGEAIYGMNDWYAEGALAEFCITRPENVAPKPASLSWEEAASVPISALTAWQGLFDRAKIKPGERLLVHGGAGAVGAYVVQLAHAHGAHVIATASARDLDLVKKLGADQAIDYRGSRFEEKTGKVDVVFDTVGGETLDRSWGLLKPGGRVVTVFSGYEEHPEQRVKDAFLIVEPNRQQLAAVAEMLDAGKLKAFVKAVVPLDKAAEAYTGAVRTTAVGKIVVAVAA